MCMCMCLCMCWLINAVFDTVPSTVQNALVDLRRLAAAIAGRLRLPDDLMCRAYLDSRGYKPTELGKCR